MFNSSFSSSRVAKVAALGLCAFALAAGSLSASAQGRGGRGHGPGPGFHGPSFHGPGPVYGGPRYAPVRRGWGPGWVLGGIGLGIGVAAASSYYYSPYYGYSYAPPAYYPEPAVAVDPAYVAPTVNAGAPQYVPSSPGAAQAQGTVPNPIFYPRNGQSAEQIEADRQDCNRWASSQQSALDDASVFQRATLACMEGRGYTAR